MASRYNYSFPVRTFTFPPPPSRRSIREMKEERVSFVSTFHSRQAAIAIAGGGNIVNAFTKVFSLAH